MKKQRDFASHAPGCQYTTHEHVLMAPHWVVHSLSDLPLTGAGAAGDPPPQSPAPPLCAVVVQAGVRDGVGGVGASVGAGVGGVGAGVVEELHDTW